MSAIYNQAWSNTMMMSAFDENGNLTIIAETWLSVLRSFSGEQIGKALQDCINRDNPFPPGLPEFKAMLLQIPSLAWVKQNLDNRESQFILLVKQNLDFFAYKRADAKQAAWILKDAYDLARQHVLEGGDLPEIPKEIEYKKEDTAKEITPEEREANRDRFKRILNEINR
jgi:hypothetical protein